jgi:hypothetical protein
VARSEKLGDFGDSWFSAKAIKVACYYILINRVKILIGLEEIFDFFEASKTQNRFFIFNGRQTLDEKAWCQKGNSPDHKLKPIINIK